MRTDDAVVAGRYAKALFEAALSVGDWYEERVGLDLKAVSPVLKELEPRLNHPGLSDEKKSAALSGSLKGRASALTGSFLNLLIKKKRLALWPIVFSKFNALVYERKNRVRARASFALPSDDETRNRMRYALENFLGKDVELDVESAPDLLGGVVVRVGDWTMDSSLKGRLERLRERLNGD